MLLVMRERIIAITMDEQRMMFLCDPVPPTVAWLFAADELGSKGQSSLKDGAPAMPLPSRPVHFALLRISVQLQNYCYSCNSEGGEIVGSIWQI